MSNRRMFQALGAAGAAALAGHAALAQTTVSDARTAPIATSAAGDVTISSEGSIKPTSGTAVTVDSDNTVFNDGTIQIDDADNSTGILVTGSSGRITNSGVILIDETTTDDIEDKDTDDDGDEDGAFVAGSNRYGIRVTSPGSFTGDVINESGASITVEGANSAAISVETDLVGSILQVGSVSATGSGAYGVRTTGKVGGSVTLSGSNSVLGEGAVGALIGDDVAGRLTVQGVISATGYRYTTRSTDQDFLDALDADDLLQGGSALIVQGDLGQGFLVDIAPVDLDEDNDDEDGDGNPDSSEGSGSISVYGGAPAVVIGSATDDVILGNVGTGDEAYGMIQRGTISAIGVYDGISATAVQLGVGGGYGVDLSGGLRNSGSISALAYEADAIALKLNAGALVPTVVNDGAISATVVSEGEDSAVALLMEQGSTLDTLINDGSVTASVAGEKADATAILDRSGTLSTVWNTGTISASVDATDDDNDLDDDDDDETNETVTGKAVALDLQANTTGVTLTQTGLTDGDDGDDDVADDDEDEDGVDDADEPSITGSILLGSGSDTVTVLNGSITGDIAFGAGANSLIIDGGAIVQGAITAAGGDLALSIGKGELRIDNTGTLNLSGLHLGTGSALILTVDPASGTSTVLDVAGQAALLDGAQIGVQLNSLLKTSASYTLIQAGSLVSGALDETLLGEIPFLYNAALVTDLAAGTITLDLARKTAQELALPAAVASAYEPMIEAIDQDEDVRDVFLAQTGRAGLVSLYNQMLPHHSDAVFQMVGANVDAYARAIGDRQGPDAGGIWVQEIANGVVRDSEADSPGYTARNIGLIGGIEGALRPLGIVGATLAGTSGQIEEEDAWAAESFVVNTVEAGGYWRYASGPWVANARLGAGYLWAKSTRGVFDLADDEPEFTGRKAVGEWSGWTLDARLAASYEARLGAAYLRPGVSVDYLRLEEDGYAEAGGGDAVDLVVESRSSSRTTAFAGLALGAQFGDRDGWWGPEASVGWREVAGGSLGDTIARFRSGSTSFTLLADEITGGGPAARAGFRGEVPGGGFVVEGGAEMRDGLGVYDLRVAAHLRF